MSDYFSKIPQIRYEGPDTGNRLAYRYYNPDEEIRGTRMRDHLRFAVAYWHAFRSTGSDPFGAQTLFLPPARGNSSS